MVTNINFTNVQVEAGQTKHIKCGRVVFTISTEFYDSSKVPTQAGVALQIGAISTTSAFSPLLGLGLMGGMMGVTCVKSVKMDGVYADGRVLVIGGRRGADSQAYELFMDGLQSA